MTLRCANTASGNTPHDFAKSVRAEIAESARVIKAAKIKL
jgi:hypothetical protein